MKKKSFNKKIFWVLSTIIFILVSGCSLDVTNPNNPTQDQVLSTQEGINALAIGMQGYYSTTALDAIIVTTAVTSRELAINTTLANLVELEEGGNQLSTDNSNILGLWSDLYHVIGMADDLLGSVNNVDMAAGTRSGIIALADLYKAMSLGYLAQSFQKAPADVESDGKAGFSDRTTLLQTAIDLLNNGLNEINTTATSSEFNSNILGPGFNLQNTLEAYLARYELLNGQYQDAINAANTVDLTVKSVFSYSTLNINPIYNEIYQNKYYAPRDSFGTPLTEPGDNRLNFYFVPDSGFSNPDKYPIDGLGGFFATATSPIPAYLPGEMHLIKAEAYARLGDLSSAVDEINAVRTKTPAQDPFGVGASLPAYSGPVTTDSVLTEIYRQRCAELFLTGMRFDDERRFDRPAPPADMTERNRIYYPYPDQERLNNPNTPPDPAI
jgi:starch-binding outer membrane protein, SusD/RagB family